MHVNNIYKTKELTKSPTIRKFRIVQTEGKRKVERDVIHYNLDTAISVGYRVNSKVATRFRQWARQVVKEFTIKGFVMDDERLKNGNTILTKQFFEELLSEFKELNGWREIVPEYVKDYVSVNQFMG
ncbi:MAG: virulence RhuM family protein [Candidatus Moranbacteria bacterium]|nr:virulence RhuM family protein [Candidatus Moranbacteria bacterium]